MLAERYHCAPWEFDTDDTPPYLWRQRAIVVANAEVVQRQREEHGTKRRASIANVRAGKGRFQGKRS